MDYLLKKFLPRIEFDSYEDFKENYKVNVPEDFNFGFDVVDAWAEHEPEKRALVWCDEEGDELTFTLAEIPLPGGGSLPLTIRLRDLVRGGAS